MDFLSTLYFSFITLLIFSFLMEKNNKKNYEGICWSFIDHCSNISHLSRLSFSFSWYAVIDLKSANWGGSELELAIIFSSFSWWCFVFLSNVLYVQKVERLKSICLQYAAATQWLISSSIDSPKIGTPSDSSLGMEKLKQLKIRNPPQAMKLATENAQVTDSILYVRLYH